MTIHPWPRLVIPIAIKRHLVGLGGYEMRERICEKGRPENP
jgi:hypothetical protein